MAERSPARPRTWDEEFAAWSPEEQAWFLAIPEEPADSGEDVVEVWIPLGPVKASSDRQRGRRSGTPASRRGRRTRGR